MFTPAKFNRNTPFLIGVFRLKFQNESYDLIAELEMGLDNPKGSTTTGCDVRENGWEHRQ
jgi:hypothetical protein